MREFYTLSLTICYCLVTAEDTPDSDIVRRLDYIREHTHPKINLPLATTELIILTNLGRGISGLVEIQDNLGRTVEYPLHQFIRYAKESYFELAKFVTKIGKKYSLDIQMRSDASNTFTLPVPDMGEMGNVPPPDMSG